MDVYAADVEQKMKRFFGWLSAKDRRRYAAVEAAKLGYGGVEYIAQAGLGVRPENHSSRPPGSGGGRGCGGGAHPQKGGGRPQLAVAQPALEANLRDLLQECTAGDPMREGVLWTNLSLRELSRRLVALGTPASRRTIRRLLRQRKLGRRTARKKKTMGHHPDRNAQFANIARLRREYEAAGDAVISIDTKKKELLGNFHRAGTTFTAETVETFDHDFGSAGQGKLIPVRSKNSNMPFSHSLPSSHRSLFILHSLSVWPILPTNERQQLGCKDPWIGRNS